MQNLNSALQKTGHPAKRQIKPIIKESHQECCYMFLNNRSWKLDNRMMIVFIALLLIISGTVDIMYKNIRSSEPTIELRYNFSDLRK